MPGLGGMLNNFGAAELIGGFVFSSVGFIAFVYGKKMHVWRPILIGIALMMYPLFVSSLAVLYSIGVVLTAALFLFRE